MKNKTIVTTLMIRDYELESLEFTIDDFLCTNTIDVQGEYTVIANDTLILQLRHNNEDWNVNFYRNQFGLGVEVLFNIVI